MNATISQSQIDIALTGCEFFLQTNNAGEIFANLRIGREVQVQFPHFVSTILDRLEQFDGAQILWRGLPKHGWYVVQFQSTLNHYLTLAARNCNPVKRGRCAPSNLPVNRLRTLNLLRDLITRRDRLASLIAPATPKSEEQALVETIRAAQRDNRSEVCVQKSISTKTIAATEFDPIPDPWELPERYPAVAAGISDRPSCVVRFLPLLPYHNDPAENFPSEEESESELWAAARSAFGEWESETRDRRRGELNSWTKAQLGDRLGWRRGKVHNTKKAALIEALLDLELS